MSVTIALPLLDRVDVASPCHARWEDMTGDERVRHCPECDLDVHNISAMTRDEAEGVLARLSEGRVCARFYRRSDGTILVQDCPVGLARVRAKARAALVRIAALIGLVGAAGVAAASTSQSIWGDRLRLRALKPFSTACAWLVPVVPPAPPPISNSGWTSGVVICIPPPPAGSGGADLPSPQRDEDSDHR